MIAPPLEASKTCAPRRRSISSTSSAAASTGKAISTSIEVSSAFQVNIGIRNIVMPGRAHAEDRGDEVDPAEDGAQAGQHQAHDPHVGADARRVDRAGQRGVGVPAERRRAARGEEAGQQDQAAEREHVVAQQVEPRERHVGRADLQRHQLVREPDEQRGGEQQQHERAVHGEQLVVLLVGHHVLVRPEELDPDEEGHHPGAQEEEERGDQVQVPDDLVVGGGQPVREDVALALGPRGDVGGDRAGRAGPGVRSCSLRAPG